MPKRRLPSGDVLEITGGSVVIRSAAATASPIAFYRVGSRASVGDVAFSPAAVAAIEARLASLRVPLDSVWCRVCGGRSRRWRWLAGVLEVAKGRCACGREG